VRPAIAPGVRVYGLRPISRWLMGCKVRTQSQARAPAVQGFKCGDWDWVWVALGWPKRGPRATQAWRKGGPSVEME